MGLLRKCPKDGRASLSACEVGRGVKGGDAVVPLNAVVRLMTLCCLP